MPFKRLKNMLYKGSTFNETKNVVYYLLSVTINAIVFKSSVSAKHEKDKSYLCISLTNLDGSILRGLVKINLIATSSYMCMIFATFFGCSKLLSNTDCNFNVIFSIFDCAIIILSIDNSNRIQIF